MSRFLNLTSKQSAMAFLLWHFCALEIQAQDALYSPDDFLFDRQIKISITATLYDNLEIDNNGPDYFNSRPCVSGELSVLYYHHLLNNIGINIGAGLGSAPFNIDYYFDAPLTSIFRTRPASEKEYLDLIHYEYVNFMAMIPFSLQKNIEMKKHLFYNIELGIKFNHLIAYPYSIGVSHIYELDETGTESAELLDFQISDTNRRSFLSYFAKIGLLKLNRKGNSLHYNVVFHWSPVDIGEGTYNFQNLGLVSNGTVRQNVNYIGFEFAYGLTRLRRLRNKQP